MSLPAQASYYSLAAHATNIWNVRENPNKPLKGSEEQVWRNVARFPSVASRLLDEDLQRRANISLTEYAVLAHLSEATTGHLRVSELADLADLSESRVTRLVEDLTKRGFVTKTRNQEDARGIDVEITEAGLSRVRDAYPFHLASVRQRIMNQVDPKALSSFGDVMAAIVRAIGEPSKGR
jgi:DNA-binding MarR family transcriptional regulator